YMGAGAWNHDATGTATDKMTGFSFDLENDLYLKEEIEGYFYIAVEHPLPIIPNIRFASTKLSNAGAGVTTVTVNIGGESFSAGTVLNTSLVLDSTDITLYYEILDNIVEFDLGLTARKLDGKFKTSSSMITATETLDETIPMLYAALGFNLPITGLSFNAEGNFIGTSDVNHSDFLLKIKYELFSVFGIEGGYRAQKFEIDNSSSITANMKFSGVFAGIFFHF
ncbi:MAG: TIGR04219 family outer membrane beta-barrel protein, partial [Thiohalomonadales bacterium]